MAARRKKKGKGKEKEMEKEKRKEKEKQIEPRGAKCDKRDGKAAAESRPGKGQVVKTSSREIMNGTRNEKIERKDGDDRRRPRPPGRFDALGF